MKSSSSAASQTPLRSSSSHSSSRPSLQSPELQAEFLQECRSRIPSHSDVSGSSVSPSSPSSPTPTSSPSSPTPTSSPSSPFSPTPTSSPFSPTPTSSPSSPCSNSRPARLSLSSPELLTELRDSRTRSLRRVPAHDGMTTVFSGRGGRGPGQASGPAPSTRPANQKTPH